ncbi:MAG TPA: nuclear transport factor 2 family protein [Acidimicrobiales bacterium]|nr:nuclear transport factor 2 family protein [Acidimicrobiales bacterium]
MSDTTTISTDAGVRHLLDRQEIADLVHRLGRALDEGRFDDLRPLLVEDATVRTPGGTAAGRDALVAQAGRNHRADENIQHVVTNLLIDLDGDRATVRANLVVYFAPLSGTAEGAVAPAVQCAMGEVYRFAVVRTPEGWRFSRIETTPVWMSGSREIGAA